MRAGHATNANNMKDILIQRCGIPLYFTRIQVVANLDFYVYLGFLDDRKYNPLFQSTHSQFSTKTVQVLLTCILVMKTDYKWTILHMSQFDKQ